MPPPNIGPNAGSDPWSFAHQQGDPNGNMSQDQAQAWAEAYARQNPGWTGNNSFFIGPDGKAHDRRSWLARNGWVMPLLAGAGIGIGALAGVGAGAGSGAAVGGAGATGGAGAATGAGAAGGAAGAATTGSVAAGVPAATTGLGGLSLPGAVGGMGAGAGATGAASGNFLSGSTGSMAFNPGAGGYTAAGNFAGGGAAGGNAAGIGAGGGMTAGGNFGGATGAGAFGGSPTVGGSGMASSGSFMDKLLSRDSLEAAGRGLGAISQTQASNRGTELDAMMEADKMRLLMERDRRESESDLWRKLQAADYMKSGGTPRPTEPMRNSTGRVIPQFNFGPRPISAANKQMASTLEQQLLQRLNNPPQMRDYDSKMKPGKMETFTNYAGPALDIASKWFGR